MGFFVLSRKKIKIKNILPNNPEIASTTGQIILRKDEGFGILCFEINCDGFLPTRARPWLVNRLLFPIMMTVVMIVNEFF